MDEMYNNLHAPPPSTPPRNSVSLPNLLQEIRCLEATLARTEQFITRANRFSATPSRQSRIAEEEETRILAAFRNQDLCPNLLLLVEPKQPFSLPSLARTWWWDGGGKSWLDNSSSMELLRCAGRCAIAFRDLSTLEATAELAKHLDNAQKEVADDTFDEDWEETYFGAAETLRYEPQDEESQEDYDDYGDEPEDESTGVPFHDLYREWSHRDVVSESEGEQ